MKTRVPLLLSLVFAVGCSDSSVTGPASLGRVVAASTAAPATAAPRITVMTQNMYIGADVDAVIRALVAGDPDAAQAALFAAVATVQETDFPARAQALAAEIARARPHVVGLQEVEELHIDLTALGFPVHIEQDFLALLQAALAARGLTYGVAEVMNLRAAPFPAIDVSVTDHDAILFDADRVLNPTVTTHTYDAEIPPTAGIVFKRSVVAIDATIDGIPVKIANTHLESGVGTGFGPLRAAQASELLAGVGTASPAILLGDFNDPPGTQMYSLVTGPGGFTDVWAALRPGAPGLTCCEPADLSNRVALLSGRIDYVFVRGISGPQGKLLGQITIVGDHPGDRVPGPSHPVWPSDHAGVVASLLLPPAPGLALQ